MILTNQNLNMGKEKIIFKITGKNTDGTPIITLNGKSSTGSATCNEGDEIQWNIQGNSGVTGICIAKTGGSNIFSSGPSKVGSSNNWKGTISDTAGGNEEDYSISASPCATPNAIWHDPRITVATGGNR